MGKRQFQPQSNPETRGGLTRINNYLANIIFTFRGSNTLFGRLVEYFETVYVVGVISDNMGKMAQVVADVYIELASALRNTTVTVGHTLDVHYHWISWIERVDIPRQADLARGYAHRLASIVSNQSIARDNAVRRYAATLARQVQHHCDTLSAELFVLTELELHRLSDRVGALYNQAIAYTDRRTAEVRDYATHVGIDARLYTDRSIAALTIYANYLVSQVRQYALQQATLALGKARRYTDAQVTLLNKTVSDAYDGTRQSQATGISKALDVIVAYTPEIKAVVGELAKLILDFAEIDNPVARIAGTLLLKQVVDHIGIDTAVGAFVNDIVSQFLGGPAPRSMAAVVVDVGNRLDTLESQWQVFMGNGGTEVEELGDDLHEMHSPVFAAIVLGVITAQILDPVSTARAVSDIIGGPVNDIALTLASALGLGG